ncbi:MAG TPA: TonB-dependent receptor [Vicinamibacteria bacterium]|nr:TonB-dependent receptor [Vicinamibacteria bacterium]
MRRSLTTLLGALALLCLSAPAWAQRTTGSILGVVTDDTGAVLPGVNVTVRGEAIVGVQSTVTNEKGLYQFGGLPSGMYDLTYEITGFGTLTRKGIRVSVGGTTGENVQLKVKQMAEEVTVSGEAPVVNTTSNTISTNYDKDWVRNAPQRRFTFFDLINMAPGVSQNTSTSSRSTSFGSGTDENSYQLDGTDFTAPSTGAAWPWPNPDAIEEIEVLSLGASAEYGNLQGAVFNVVTRQGSNAFHGDANFYLQAQDLTSDNTSDLRNPDGSFVDACPADDTQHCPYNRDKFRDASFQLTGPIIKDKLWFFGSYQYQRDYDSQPGTDPAFPAGSDADRIFFKINWQINQKNKVFFALHDDYYDIPERGQADTAPSALAIESGHNPSPNVTFTSVLSDKTYVELRYSGFYGDDHGDPLNGGERVQPRFYDNASGRISGGIYYWYDGSNWKTAFAGKLSHFADNFMGGSHDFKFGVQYNSGGQDYLWGYNDYIYVYDYEGYEPYAYGYTQAPFNLGGNMRNIGVFADDSFRLNDRLTINLGVRYDNSKAYISERPLYNSDGSESGQAPGIDELYTWNSVSPRVGFNLKLTEDGKTVLRGHYGRYYRAIVVNEFSTLGPAYTPRYFGAWDLANNRFFEDTLVQTASNQNQRVDPNYKNPYTDQFIIGFERELFKDVGVQLNYIHKKSRDYGAWTDTAGQYADFAYVDNEGADASGQTIILKELLSDPEGRQFLLTNPSTVFTDVDAVTLQVNKRMSNHWQMTAALTYLDSRGRNASSDNSPTGGSDGQAGLFGQNPNDFVNTDGELVSNRPWTFRTQLVYEAPAGFMFGANYTYQSGKPWARLIRLGSSVLGQTTTFLAEQIDGSRRVDNWNLLDLRIQKSFKLGGTSDVAIFADILNTFNDNANETVLDRRGTSANFGVPSRFLLPRRLMLGAKLRF